MPVVNVSEAANKVLLDIWEEKGIQKKWLASRCILDHAHEYIKKNE